MSSIASSTWPKGLVSKNLEQTLADCLNVLTTLNREFNTEVDSAAADPAAGEVSRDLAYAMAEIVRMIRDSQEQAPDHEHMRRLGRAAWRVEAAWSAVLAGDVDDILRHVELVC